MDPHLLIAACTLAIPRDFATVQEGIDASADGDVVCIDAGTWVGPLDLGGRSISLVGRGSGLTVLEGNGLEPVIRAESGEVATIGRLAITGGGGAAGGGIQAYGASLTLVEVSLEGNATTGSGGGIQLQYGDLALYHVRVAGNTSGYSGGGIYAAYANLTASALAVERNVSDGWGGGLSLHEVTIDFEHVEFLHNSNPTTDGSWGGGGMFAQYVTGAIRNTAFVGNESLARGGAFYIAHGAAVTMENVILAHNTALNGGAAFILYPGAMVDFVNASIFGNRATSFASGIWLYGGAVSTIAHTNFWDNGGVDVDGAYTGTALVFADPLFLPGTGFQLAPGSPLLDAGDPLILDPDGTVSDIGVHGGPGAYR